jgi:tRNA threonylcarbamoyl adenosine modification protein YeaZ
MRILALDSATGRCSATLAGGGTVLAAYQSDIERGHGSVLPVMARACLHDAGLTAMDLDLIAVTVGPGGFTGIRGGIALAQGLALSAGKPVVGVTVGEALADSLPPMPERDLWCATVSRRGRVFLETGGQVLSLAVTELPVPGRPVALAGGAAADIAERLAARGIDVILTDAKLPNGMAIARVAQRRFLGTIRPLPAEPLYVDPPEAKLPGGRLPPETVQ